MPLIALLLFPGGLALLAGGLVYEWVDRKLVARFQNRLGPPWYQPLADLIKLLAKEEIIPTGVNAALFLALPVVALAGPLTAALNVPLQGGSGQLSNGHRAKTQVHAEVAGPFDGREVARFVVIVHAVKERFKQGMATAAASGYLEAG